MADAVHAVGGQDHGHGHDHGHDHPAHLQHHFETSSQQFDASKLGMWLFLSTEVLFFAGLFCFYAVVRHNHPEIFAVGHKHLSVFWGAVNTIVLIASSFTMALGVYCAQKSNRNGLIICLILTLAGAATFMVVKSIEYTEKIRHGNVWGSYYTGYLHEGHAEHAGAGEHSGATTNEHAGSSAPAGASTEHGAAASTPAAGHSATPAADTSHAAPAADAGHAAAAAPPAQAGALAFEVSQIKPPVDAPEGLKTLPVLAGSHDAHDAHDTHAAEIEAKNLHIFFSIYFCMTGLHGIHVIAGMIVITWLLIGAIKGKYNGEYYTPIDLGGLYWHLVDLVWIYLFPMLYLIH